MQIISGSSSQELAKRIAKKGGFELFRAQVENFEDSELRVQIFGTISKDVAIIQSTNSPVNDNLMELLLLIDTARRAGAETITAVIPYFGYSRQDHSAYQHGPVAAKLAAKMIETAGATKIITLDLHSDITENGLDIPIESLSTESIFLPELQNMHEVTIIAPDAGGVRRSRNYSTLLAYDFAIIEKTRNENNDLSMGKIKGNVTDRNCIIIDDIADSANTLCMATELLVKNGAKNIDALITHAVLSGNAIQKIIDSPLKNIYISDSIKCKNLPKKFKILEIDDLLISALRT